MHDHADDFDWGHPNFGIEFDWLGVDSASHVSVLSTAGYGPIPEAVMPHAAELDDAFERTVPGLPVVGQFNVESVPGSPAFWERYSQQGLFGFDWKLWAGPYVRVTSPSVAVTIDDLPGVVRELALLVFLPLDFGTTTQFKLDDLGIPIARKLDE